MTVVVVVVAVIGLALLAVGVALLVRQQQLLARLEALLARDPVGLTAEDATAVAETAARIALAGVLRPSLPPALREGDVADDDAPARRSDTRIRAAGWAAGAGETVRRLRRGA